MRFWEKILFLVEKAACAETVLYDIKRNVFYFFSLETPELNATRRTVGGGRADPFSLSLSHSTFCFFMFPFRCCFETITYSSSRGKVIGRKQYNAQKYNIFDFYKFIILHNIRRWVQTLWMYQNEMSKRNTKCNGTAMIHLPNSFADVSRGSSPPRSISFLFTGIVFPLLSAFIYLLCMMAACFGWHVTKLI